MQSLDMLHIIAAIVGFVFSILWNKFSPATPPPIVPAPVAPAPVPAVPIPVVGGASLAAILDNPNAVALLRELLHAQPPTPPAPSPPGT